MYRDIDMSSTQTKLLTYILTNSEERYRYFTNIKYYVKEK